MPARRPPLLLSFLAVAACTGAASSAGTLDAGSEGGPTSDATSPGADAALDRGSADAPGDAGVSTITSSSASSALDVGLTMPAAT